MAKNGFDHYIGIVESSNGNEKTASAKPSTLNQELLSKIANELVGVGREGVAGADPAMQAAKDGSEAALLLAGLDAAAQAAGDVAKPAPAPAQPMIGSAAPEGVKSVMELNKEQAAVAEAAGAGPVKTAELQRAEEIGVAMANAFNAELEKKAFDREYQGALEFLTSRGYLANYDIVS